MKADSITRAAGNGTEYSLSKPGADAELLPQNGTGFSGKPLWLRPSPAGTRDLWRTVLLIHILLLPLFSFAFDDGAVSIPGGIYCLTVIGWLAIRFTVARFRGYPALAPLQSVALLLLPAWAPFLMAGLYHLVQHLKG